MVVITSGMILVGSVAVMWGSRKTYKHIKKVIKKNKIKRRFMKKSKKIKSKDICVICQEDFMKKSRCTELYCGHKYHKHCIRRWICEKPTCPLCNTILKENK